MKIIVPCCGRSSRYPDMPPKWMLPDPEGVPMIVRAVEHFDVNADNLVVTILQEHEERFAVTEGLAQAFGFAVRTVILPEPTSSQSDTVAQTLRQAAIEEPFIVKDSDNAFALSDLEQATNYVSVASLNDFDMINPRNKSYVTVDQDLLMTSIHEKKVVSDLFSVGGYYFTDPEAFLEVFDRLSADQTVRSSEIYISEIIAYMLVQGEPFKARRVQRYEDWGTVHEWRRKLESRKLYLVSVDGFLFERGSTHFQPTFADAAAHNDAIEAVRGLAEAGHSIVYLSIRPRDLRDETRARMEAAGLPEGELVMDCDVSQWTLVTAPHASLPLVTARARELAPDDANLVEKLLGPF